MSPPSGGFKFLPPGINEKYLLGLTVTLLLGNIMPSLKKKNAAKKAKHEAKTGK